MNYEDRDTLGMYKVNDIAGPGPDARRGPGPEIMGANTLVGNDVYNPKHEDLGDIKETMLDMRSGQVGYAVLSFGGFLGMGEKLFAVPWNALLLDTKNKRFVSLPKQSAWRYNDCDRNILGQPQDGRRRRTRRLQGPRAHGLSCSTHT